jgi:hypothetical protein
MRVPVETHLAEVLLWPVEPSAHLPHLAGRFLVLEGRDYQLIAAPAAARLRELTPAPKRVPTRRGFWHHNPHGRAALRHFQEHR